MRSINCTLTKQKGMFHEKDEIKDRLHQKPFRLVSIQYDAYLTVTF